MKTNGITVAAYLDFVRRTDRLPESGLASVMQGLFGEIGGLMSTIKKPKREPEAYTGFDEAVIEELGDAFWYLCCLGLRLGVDIDQVFLAVANETGTNPEVYLTSGYSPLAVSYSLPVSSNFEELLFELGHLTGQFLNVDYVRQCPTEKLTAFLKIYFAVVSHSQINFERVIEHNIRKVSSRFIRPENSELPVFDREYEDFERLPDQFEIEFIKRTSTKQAMRWNGVFVGDPLTDSIMDPDGYRFHDVFHFSYASILHWSPTFRSLIKHKRKSNPSVDSAEDGGRAIVVEEGLSAWIFNIAKENSYFEGRKSLTFDMLKNVSKMVQGFEVEVVPLILWEEAILKGYEVFRQVLKNDGGIVIGNRTMRTLDYKKS